MERRFYENLPVSFSERDDSAEKRINCRFATFTDVYDLGYDCYERIDSHAFDETLGDDIRILYNHDTGAVLGRVKNGTASLSISDGEGLDGNVLINPEDRSALDAYARVKRGDVSGCSIGFDILAEHTERRENKVGYVIDKIKLYECSICTFPAYEATSAQARSMDHARSRAFKERMKERLNNALKGN